MKQWNIRFTYHELNKYDISYTIYENSETLIFQWLRQHKMKNFWCVCKLKFEFLQSLGINYLYYKL